jgi:hypothetical protein
MPKFDQYYIVEYRVAIRVDNVGSIQEAVSRSSKICQRQHGFKPDNWYARIFEYTTGDANVGSYKEYFYNPFSSASREITKNIGYHNDMVKAGVVPETPGDYERLLQESGIGEEEYITIIDEIGE